jgi:hypothetical protein
VSIARRFPTEVDTIVIGAGTAGAVVADRLAPARARPAGPRMRFLRQGVEDGQAVTALR